MLHGGDGVCVDTELPRFVRNLRSSKEGWVAAANLLTFISESKSSQSLSSSGTVCVGLCACVWLCVCVLGCVCVFGCVRVCVKESYSFVFASSLFLSCFLSIHSFFYLVFSAPLFLALFLSP